MGKHSRDDDSPSGGGRWPYKQFGGPGLVLTPRGSAWREISELLGRVQPNGGQVSFGGESGGLPAQPGLVITGVGPVSVPLHDEEVARVMDFCLPQGYHVWSFMPQQVQMINPQWEEAIQTLSKEAADKLGFVGTGLEPELSKLMVYGDGARPDLREQDIEDDGPVVAKLLVQLPSDYAGGDLVVVESETQQLFRYDLGKANGTAAFGAHYVVYTAGAAHAFGDVVTGYRLVATYSLRLPLEVPTIGGTRSSDLLRMQLVEAMKDVAVDSEFNAKASASDDKETGLEQSRFALLLSTSCSQLQLESVGVEALSDSDRDRFQLLVEANALLPLAKQLKFYLGWLKHTGSGKNGLDKAAWYLLSGEALSEDTLVEWTTRLNFLNPGKETVKELFGGWGMFGFERGVLVGWPACADIPSTYKLMGEFGAAASVLADTPLDLSRLRMLLQYDAANHEDSPEDTANNAVVISPTDNPFFPTPSSQSPLLLCEKLCNAIIESGDFTLVKIFFDRYFSRLREKTELIPWVAAFVRTFGWYAMGDIWIEAVTSEPPDTSIELVLKLVDALNDNPTARKALTMIAVEKTRCWADTERSFLPSCDDLRLLLKYAMAYDNPDAFAGLESVFMAMDGQFLGPVVDELAKCVDALSSPEHFVALESVASRRRQWLTARIAAIDQTMIWEIPITDFPEAATIEKFLRSDEETLQIKGYTGIKAARAQAALLKRKVKAPLEIVALGVGRKAHIQLRKTIGTFGDQHAKLQDYKAELDRLAHLTYRDESTSDWSNDNFMDTTGTKLLVEEVTTVPQSL